MCDHQLPCIPCRAWAHARSARYAFSVPALGTSATSRFPPLAFLEYLDLSVVVVEGGQGEYLDPNVVAVEGG